jgi:hypothetical protein
LKKSKPIEEEETWGNPPKNQLYPDPEAKQNDDQPWGAPLNKSSSKASDQAFNKHNDSHLEFNPSDIIQKPA